MVLGNVVSSEFALREYAVYLDVLSDGAVEEYGLLRYHTDDITKIVQIVRGNIVTIESQLKRSKIILQTTKIITYPSSFQIVVTKQQRDNGRLARSCNGVLCGNRRFIQNCIACAISALSHLRIRPERPSLRVPP